MSASRDRILERLRRAAPPAPSGAPLPPLPEESALFADGPWGSSSPSKGDLMELFRERFGALKGELELAGGAAEAGAAIARLLDEAGAGPVAAQAHPLVEEVLACDPRLRSRVEPGRWLDADAPVFARCVAGISAVDALVARSGSLVLRSSACGGRRLSVLPPLHIALARRCQLLPSLGDALAMVGRDPEWSYAAVVSGPSRTADIEKILVLGAHGPRRLALVIIDPGAGA